MGDNLQAMRLILLSAVSVALSWPLQAFSEGPIDASAAPVQQAASADTLDRARIHAEYGDGNFEVVIQTLEEYRAGHKSFAPADSLFMAKYLGVVYASNPASREKGKYWLYRMLQLDPAADLVDMYVGEAVDRTFERVRQEFIVRRNYRGINDMKLARAVAAGTGTHDTVVVRDTVRVGSPVSDSLPARKPEEHRFGWTGNLNLGVGLKLMDKTQWGSTRQQKEFRAALDVRQRRWPINIALDFLYSRSEKTTYRYQDGTTFEYRQSSSELNAGVRKIFDGTLYSMRPLMGAGFGYMTTWIDNIDYQEGTLGAWAEGGIYWELERHFNLGAEALWSWAEIPDGVGGSANAGGFHFEMILGYHW